MLIEGLNRHAAAADQSDVRTEISQLASCSCLVSDTVDVVIGDPLIMTVHVWHGLFVQPYSSPTIAVVATPQCTNLHGTRRYTDTTVYEVRSLRIISLISGAIIRF